MICSPLLESIISRAHGDRRSQIEKHVVFSVRSNLPSKCSTVLSEPKFGPPPPPKSKMTWFTTFTLTIIHLIYPPPPPKSIIFKFSWEDCKSQEKLETMLMQNFWGVTKVYCGNLKAANPPLLSVFDPWEWYSEVLGWGFTAGILARPSANTIPCLAVLWNPTYSRK